MGSAAIATLQWVGLPPAEIDGPTCLVREDGQAPQRWVDHGAQYLDVWDAVAVLHDRKVHVIHLLLEDSDRDYVRYVVDTLHSDRVMAYADDVLWLNDGEVQAQFLLDWRAELARKPSQPQVALTLALYRAQMAMWLLPPWKEYD